MPTPPLLPPIAGQPISVVLLRPDSDRETVVAAWRDFLTGRQTDHEILVVDNPAGDGAALRDGLAQARYPLVCYAPCHPDYRPDYLGQLLDRPFVAEEPPGANAAPGKEIDHVHLMSGFRAGVPVPWPLRATGAVWRVVGWVVLSYAPPRWPGWLGWRRWVGGMLARVFFSVRYRDVSCPFRLFRREILTRLPIQSDTAFAHVELVAKANFLGCVMSEELPLDVKPGPYRGDFGRMWKEARRLFNKPDFGPPPGPQLSQPPAAG
jgi:hypothetical protein